VAHCRWQGRTWLLTRPSHHPRRASFGPVKLKAKPGGELQVHGSGALIRWLLENKLVDEINLLIVPVVVGQGTRLFPDAGPDIALDLVDSRAFPKGITIQVYRPAGRPEYAT
jgi:dihydrofolate reductase